ncbi:MAG: pentapeptide repeat-containing protein [Mesorhizobium sp.]|nr:MAG: pentapeptide repeat-containing protein [Mesorhizobium sp.]
MAVTEHVSLLGQGVEAWNAWRRAYPDVHPDLVGSSFFGMNLTEANFIGANLTGMALIAVNLTRANLTGATIMDVNLSGSNLTGAILAGASLNDANLRFAVLCDADLVGASLQGAILIEANFSGANLVGADLSGASLVTADFTNTDLTGCRVYGVSAWGLKLDGAKQQNLIITDHGEPEITVDNIEVAQFIYLLLHNQKIRDVIDTITSKAVLILGRFTPERKEVLDMLREELRRRDRTPIIFDFDKPGRRNLTDTVKLLAQMVRYIIVDLSDPKSGCDLDAWSRQYPGGAPHCGGSEALLNAGGCAQKAVVHETRRDSIG